MGEWPSENWWLVGFFQGFIEESLGWFQCVKVDTFQFSQFSGGFKGHCT